MDLIRDYFATLENERRRQLTLGVLGVTTVAYGDGGDVAYVVGENRRVIAPGLKADVVRSALRRWWPLVLVVLAVLIAGLILTGTASEALQVASIVAPRSADCIASRRPVAGSTTPGRSVLGRRSATRV